MGDGPETVTFHPVEVSGLGTTGATADFAARNAAVRQAVDEILEAALGPPEMGRERLNEAMRYAVLGGKRFRAVLLGSVAETLGVPHGQAMRVAAAIECVHAQSLIHDDLPCMDDDDTRRGRATLHKAFDEATAVLAGDALLALAFELLVDEATAPDPAIRARLVSKLAQSLGQRGLAGGQIMDLFPPDSPSNQFSMECERLKTGALITFSVEAALILADADDHLYRALYRFADNLGLLFQVKDDLLDALGNEQELGKAVRKDHGKGRPSSTAVLGVDRALDKASELERECLEVLASLPADTAGLRQVLNFASQRTH
jgi:geranylgeranyl pyrophosphate synthase